MSDNVIKNAERFAKTMSSQKTLLNRDDPKSMEMHQYMADLKRALAGEVEVSGTKKLVPRFGALSLLAGGTGFFVYDHPDMVKQFPTAFACGDYVFFNASFLRTLKEDSNESAAFVALHELMHINLLHALRLRDINPKIANMAMDYMINTRIRTAFESSSDAKMFRDSLVEKGGAPDPVATLKFGDSVRIGLGFKEGDLQKYGRLSEEEIAKILRTDLADQLRDMLKNGELKPDDGSGNGVPIDLDELAEIDPDLAKELRDKLEKEGGKPSKGGGQPSQSGSGGAGSPGSGVPQAGPSSGTRGGSQEGNPNPDWKKPGSLGQSDKVMTEDELRKVLGDLGIDGVADKLGLANTVEESDKRSENRAIKAKSMADQSARLNKDAGVKVAGGHIDSMMLEVLGDIARPKMSYKVALHHTICGSGKLTQFTDDAAAPIFYVDPSDMGLTSEVYVGSHIPYQRQGDVLVLVDTSGSMGTMDLKSAVAEIAGLAKEEHDDIRVILCWCDTVIRAVEVLNERDIENKSEWGVPGRGGTDMATCINQAMELPLVSKSMSNGRLAGLLYYTDLGDTPPRREDMPKKMPPICYIATDTASGVTQFRRAVGGYAQVVEIDPGLQVDLENKKTSSPSP
jgi:uncharacterized membrane protein YgcG